MITTAFTKKLVRPGRSPNCLFAYVARISTPPADPKDRRTIPAPAPQTTPANMATRMGSLSETRCYQWRHNRHRNGACSLDMVWQSLPWIGDRSGYAVESRFCGSLRCINPYRDEKNRLRPCPKFEHHFNNSNRCDGVHRIFRICCPIPKLSGINICAQDILIKPVKVTLKKFNYSIFTHRGQ